MWRNFEPEMDMDKYKYKWIPWRRYVLLLGVDGHKKTITRIPRKDSAAKAVARLSMYKGYAPEVFDTKTQEVLIFRETKKCHKDTKIPRVFFKKNFFVPSCLSGKKK